MKFKAIIFDMDGTIIDTEHIWEHATGKLLTLHGVEYTQEHKEILAPQLRGLQLHNSCSIIRDMFELSCPIDDLVKQKSELANQLYRQEVIFIDGFVEFHQQVVAAQLKNGIATNADDDTVAAVKQKLNLEKYFGEHIYGISHVAFAGKPNPAIYLHTAAQLNIDPKDCIAIEDSAYGIEAAQRAGMFCIGINSSGDRDAIKKADKKIDHYKEIDLDALLEW
jgi:beta-phosphoglucomutase